MLLLFQREQIQRKSNRLNRLFGSINTSGRIVNDSRPRPNYRPAGGNFQFTSVGGAPFAGGTEFFAST